EARPELADVQVAALIGLGETEKRHIESPTVIKVELIGLINNVCRVDGRTEIEPARWYAADDPWFCRQSHQVRDFFLGRDVGNAFGHADAEIYDAIGLELECRASGDDLALAHLHRRG